MEYNWVRGQVKSFGGRLRDARDYQFDGKRYSFKAYFDNDENADEFIAVTNVKQSAREIDEHGYFVLYFSF